MHKCRQNIWPFRNRPLRDRSLCGQNPHAFMNFSLNTILLFTLYKVLPHNNRFTNPIVLLFILFTLEKMYIYSLLLLALGAMQVACLSFPTPCETSTISTTLFITHTAPATTTYTVSLTNNGSFLATTGPLFTVSHGNTTTTEVTTLFDTTTVAQTTLTCEIGHGCSVIFNGTEANNTTKTTLSASNDTSMLK